MLILLEPINVENCLFSRVCPTSAIFVARNTWSIAQLSSSPNCANCLTVRGYVNSVHLLETLATCWKSVSWVFSAFVGNWTNSQEIRMGNSVFCDNTSFWLVIGLFENEQNDPFSPPHPCLHLLGLGGHWGSHAAKKWPKDGENALKLFVLVHICCCSRLRNTRGFPHRPIWIPCSIKTGGC